MFGFFKVFEQDASLVVRDVLEATLDGNKVENVVSSANYCIREARWGLRIFKFLALLLLVAIAVFAPYGIVVSILVYFFVVRRVFKHCNMQLKQMSDYVDYTQEYVVGAGSAFGETARRVNEDTLVKSCSNFIVDKCLRKVRIDSYSAMKHLHDLRVSSCMG